MLSELRRYGQYTAIFFIFQTILEARNTKKIAKNLNSLGFCMLSVFLYISRFISLTEESSNTAMSYLGTSFFTYDVLRILADEDAKKSIPYIVHHVATITAINLDPIAYQWPVIYFWAELSNIPIYVLYHYLHTPNALLEQRNGKRYRKSYIFLLEL